MSYILNTKAENFRLAKITFKYMNFAGYFALNQGFLTGYILELQS